MGNPAQRQRDAACRQIGQFLGHQKGAACGHFGRGGFVVGGNAAHGIDDAAVHQGQAVVRRAPHTIPVRSQDPISVPYSNSPAKSPVKGRPVRLAPRRPGASPTTKNRASRVTRTRAPTRCARPDERVTLARRKAVRRGHTGCNRARVPGSAVRHRGILSGAWCRYPGCWYSWSPASRGSRGSRGSRLPSSRLVSGCGDAGLKVLKLLEVVGLTAQFVGHHGRLRADRADDGHPRPLRWMASTRRRKSPSPENRSPHGQDESSFP